MLKRVHHASLVVLVTLLLGCETESAENAEAPKSTTTVVDVIEVQHRPYYQVSREYVGTVKAPQSAQLGFELAGKIERIEVSVGDSVEKGQPLVRLDTQLLDNEAQQLTAQLAQVDAQRDLIRSNLVRQQSLKKKGFSADAEIDSLTSERDSLLANRRQIEASIASNTLRKAKSVIYAPYSGIISERFVSQGDVVNLGSPTVTLLSDGVKEARIGIPEKYMDAILQSPNYKVRIGERVFPARLNNSGADVGAQSRTVELRFVLPENVEVREGQLAYLQFDMKIPQTGFWVPLTALTDGLRGTWNLYTVTEGSEGKTLVSRKAVNVHYADDERAFVAGDLKDGERVISAGIHRIVAGQPVAIAKE